MSMSLRHPERQQKLLQAFKNVADSGKLTEGVYAFNLERKFGQLLHGQYAVTFNSDGSAWYTLFKFYSDHGHKAVAIADNSFYAVGAMALEAGLKVLLVDSCVDHPSMSPESLEHVLDSNKYCRLVVLNHVGGWIAPHEYAIADLCEKFKADLLEDCTDVLGIQVSGAHPGTVGSAAVWSFYSSKPIPAGESGVITTHMIDIRDYARLFRQCGKHVKGNQLYYGKGMSLKISEWDAACACVQLEHLKEIIEGRKKDWLALQSIAPPLINHAPTNYYKYVVSAEIATGLKTLPQIYSPTDQLHACLPKCEVGSGSLVNSYRWSKNHACLPVGEGQYDGLDEEGIFNQLVKPFPVTLRFDQFRKQVQEKGTELSA